MDEATKNIIKYSILAFLTGLLVMFLIYRFSGDLLITPKTTSQQSATFSEYELGTAGASKMKAAGV